MWLFTHSPYYIYLQGLGFALCLFPPSPAGKSFPHVLDTWTQSFSPISCSDYNMQDFNSFPISLKPAPSQTFLMLPLMRTLPLRIPRTLTISPLFLQSLTFIIFYLLPHFDPCFMLTLSFHLPISRILVFLFSQPLPWSLNIPTFLFFSTRSLFVPCTPHLFPLFSSSRNFFSPLLKIPPSIAPPSQLRVIFKCPEEGQLVTLFCFHRLTFVSHKSSNPHTKKSQTLRNVQDG